MSTTVRRFVRARASALRGVLLAIAAATALAVALLCGLSAYAQVELGESIRSAIPDSSESAGALLLQTRPAADVQAQDAAAREVVGRYAGDVVAVESVVLEQGTDLERVAWRVTPLEGAYDLDRVPALADGLQRLPDAFRTSAAAQGGGASSGGLATALAEIAEGARAASALLPVPLVILGVLAWFAVLQLGRLLGLDRGRETALTRARGLSARQAVSLSAIEAAVVCGAGTVVGFVGALAVLAVAGGAAGVAASLATWPWALGIFVVATATVVVSELQAAHAASGASSRAGRASRATSPALGVLIVLVGAILVWQAQTTATDNDAWAVLVSTLAPAFGVVAAALLAVLLFAPVSRLIARFTTARPGIDPSYAARQVSRRLGAYSVAVALVAIAVCGALLAATYAGTTDVAARDSADLRAGAPLRATTAESVTGADLAVAASVPGVTVATPVLTAPIAAGSGDGRLVALSPAAMPDVLYVVRGAANPTEIADAVTAESGAISAPAGAVLTVEATVTTTDTSLVGSTLVFAWIMSPDGLVSEVPLTVTAVDGAALTARLTAEGAIPDGEWAVVSVDVARTHTETLRFTEIVLALDGEALPGAVATAMLAGSGFPGDPNISRVAVWSAGSTERLPAAITRSYAEALGLSTGDALDLSFAGIGRTVAAEVALVADGLPGIGASPGAIVSLPGVVERGLAGANGTEPAPAPARAQQIWAADDPAAQSAAGALAQALGVPVSVPDDPGGVLTAPIVTVWSVAAIGGAVLAGIAVIALLQASTRQRAGEVLVLRAVGLSPRWQTRSRQREALSVVVIAAILGVVGGYVLSALLVPGLTRRAVPGIELAPPLSFDPLPLLITLVVIAAGLVIACIRVGASIRSQSRSTRLEEAAA